MLTTVAQATNGSLTGQVAIQLTINSGCSVGNGSVSGGTNQWGTLNFGSYLDLTNVISGIVLGADDFHLLTINCNNDQFPMLSLNGGLAPTNGQRAMSSDGNSIPYRLYSDSAASIEIDIDKPIPILIDKKVQKIPIYGRVLPSDQTSTTPAAGTYNDTVVATLFW